MVTVTVFAVQPDEVNVTLPFCFFTVTVNEAEPVPLTLADVGDT